MQLGVIAVGIGGALGAMGRYLTGHAILRLVGPGFPWGTFAVNLIGSFLMGLAFWVLVGREAPGGARFVPLVMTGFLGGYTTFSAYALDTHLLWQQERWLAAALYVVGTVAGSLAALLAGIALAQRLVE